MLYEVITLGTGDAARCGLSVLSKKAKEVVVLCGDAPLSYNFV